MPTFHPAASTVPVLPLPRQPNSTTTAGHDGPGRQQPNALRSVVVSRLAVMCRRHARHTAELAATPHPVGRHALVFLFREPSDAPVARVKVATRLFHDEPEARDLPGMLHQLVTLADAYNRTVGFDPRLHMTNRVEAMDPRASYFGVGISSVYTTVPHQLAGRIPNRGFVERTPGADYFTRGIALLDDGTELLLYNRGLAEPYIEASHTLDHGPMPSRMWNWLDPHAQSNDPDLPGARHGLAELHALAGEQRSFLPAPGRTRSTTRQHRRR